MCAINGIFCHAIIYLELRCSRAGSVRTAKFVPSLTVDPEDLYIVEPLKFSPEKKVQWLWEGQTKMSVFLPAGGAWLSCSPVRRLLGLVSMLCFPSRT